MWPFSFIRYTLHTLANTKIVYTIIQSTESTEKNIVDMIKVYVWLPIHFLWECIKLCIYNIPITTVVPALFSWTTRKRHSSACGRHLSNRTVPTVRVHCIQMNWTHCLSPIISHSIYISSIAGVDIVDFIDTRRTYSCPDGWGRRILVDVQTATGARSGPPPTSMGHI